MFVVFRNNLVFTVVHQFIHPTHDWHMYTVLLAFVLQIDQILIHQKIELLEGVYFARTSYSLS